MFSHRSERLVWATPQEVRAALDALGRDGVFADRWLWRLRTLVAPLLVQGGDPATDYWRLEEVGDPQRFALACTMRGLGEARVAWSIEPRPAGRALLVQTASLSPSGTLGSLYWRASLPPHSVVFARLLRGIALHAERGRAPAGRPTRGLRLVRRAIDVPCGLDHTFAFFADARNLEAITPPWLHFEILTPTPIAMRRDARIAYRIRLHGLPVRWQTNIDAWEPPDRFVDRQVSGPYRWWHHEHRFEAVDGGTRVIDEVEYVAPFRTISEPLLVRRDVERIFDYRAERLGQLLGKLPGPPRPAATADQRPTLANF